MKPTFSFFFEAMGTWWSVATWDEISPELQVQAKEEIVNYARTFDQTYSRFIASSLVMKKLQNPGTYTVPRHLIEMLKLYFGLYDVTGGKMNPMIGNTLSDLGYDAEYRLSPKNEVAQTPDLSQALEILSEDKIHVKMQGIIDLGALGKGFCVDRICDVLKNMNIQSYLVDGSGDVYYKHPTRSMYAGLEHPNDPNKVIGKVTLWNKALCSSGTNRRKWGDNHHIIDGKTGKSTKGIISTWVLADNAAIADALATALFLIKPKQLQSAYDFQYVVLQDDFSLTYSQELDAEFY